MEGTSPKDKLDSTYFTALQKNWMVWPFVQAINFKLVPLEHRVLVVNVVSLGNLDILRDSSNELTGLRMELLSELPQQQGEVDLRTFAGVGGFLTKPRRHNCH